MLMLTSEASLYCSEAAETFEWLLQNAETHSISQHMDGGDHTILFGGGKAMLRADHDRLLLRVEASEVLLRLAIEDILAIQLSVFHKNLPDPLLWIPGTSQRFAAVSAAEINRDR